MERVQRAMFRKRASPKEKCVILNKTDGVQQDLCIFHYYAEWPLLDFTFVYAMLNLVKNLLQHEKALHALANALLEYETLNAEEIKRILVPYSGSELFVEQEQQVEAELVLA